MSRVDFRLYLITDEEIAGDEPRMEAALGALPPGLAAVQLRARALSGRALLDRALRLRALTHRHGAALLVNDRLDVALAAGADGAHLPVAGLPVAAARALAPGLVLGASTHSLAEARAAQAAGADLVTFGPVFATPSKAAFGAPVGVPALADAVKSLTVPVFALGGIDETTAPSCLTVGARLAAIRAILGAPDPAAAAARFAALLPRRG